MLRPVLGWGFEYVRRVGRCSGAKRVGIIADVQGKPFPVDVVEFGVKFDPHCVSVRTKSTKGLDRIDVAGGCRECGVVDAPRAFAFRVAETIRDIRAIRADRQRPGLPDLLRPALVGGRGAFRLVEDDTGRGAGQRLGVAVVVVEAHRHLQLLAHVRVGQRVGGGARTGPDVVVLQRGPVGGEPLPVVRRRPGDAGDAVVVGDAADVRREHRRHTEHRQRHDDGRHARSGHIGGRRPEDAAETEHHGRMRGFRPEIRCVVSGGPGCGAVRNAPAVEGTGVLVVRVCQSPVDVVGASLGHHPVVGRSGQPDESGCCGRRECVSGRRARGQRRRAAELGHHRPGRGPAVQRHRRNLGARDLGTEVQVDAVQAVASPIAARREPLSHVELGTQAQKAHLILRNVAHQQRGRRERRDRADDT